MLVETVVDILRPISCVAYGDPALSFYGVPTILGGSVDKQ